jgi:chromatin assembly factor 1 subunit B
VQGIAVDPRF